MIPYFENCRHSEDGWCLSCISELGREIIEQDYKVASSDKTNKVLSLIGELLDRWDELPNDVTSEPELSAVERIISMIGNLVDDDSVLVRSHASICTGCGKIVNGDCICESPVQISQNAPIKFAEPAAKMCKCGARDYEPHKRWCHTNTASR